MARINTLGNFLTDVADAIREKKGTTDTILASNFDTEIASIEGGGDINEYLSDTITSGNNSLGGWINTIKKMRSPLTVKGTSAEYMFYNYKLNELPQLDTSNVTDMNHMFTLCTNLTIIPQLDTSNVTNMGSMFRECYKLTTIPQLDTSNVTQMNYMFYECKVLTTVSFDTRNVNLMGYMFYNCHRLTTIDITHMNITQPYNISAFASNCYSLTKLIIRNMPTIPSINTNSFNNCYHFTGTTNATYNPQGLKDGRIYVPDDKVETLKVTTNWSVYADIIVPLSTLVE